MADDISFKATLDNTQVTASAQRMEANVKKASSNIQAEFSRINVSQQKIGSAGGSGSYRLGQTALQAQDVAVSLQSGAKASTVIAQQGSQIASIFGPTGNIVGGVLTVGSALIGWVLSLKQVATHEEIIAQKAKDFGEKIERIQSVSDRMSKGLFENFDERSNLAARVKGGQLGENELKLDKERNKELEEAWQLSEDLIKSGADMNNEDVTNLVTAVEQKHALKDILAITDRIAEAMQNVGKGAHAAAGAAQSEIGIQKELLKIEEEHADAFTKQEDKFAKMDKSARALLEHVKDFGNEMTKGLDKFLGNFDRAAQFRQVAKQWLSGGASAVKRADDLLDPAGARERRRQDHRQLVADRTIAERDVNRLDRENGGLPGHHRLSPAERKAAVEARVKRAQDLRHPQKISLDEADITKLANAMMAAAAQQNAK